MDPIDAVTEFFRPLIPLKKPLLVGYSGGEDSLALIKILQRLSISHHLAHFDHGWREESRREAALLASLAQVPFHTKRCEVGALDENEARKKRYAFFSELYKTGAFEAIVLAHHQNDQAETVLKRMLEGSHLSSLRGIAPISYREEMPIWRPLLRIPKERLLRFLATTGEKPLDDPTNRDPKYLRARMRSTLLPNLAQEFGKEVACALTRIGDYGSELSDYLEVQTKKFQPISGPFGVMWDFSLAHPIEIRSIIHKHLMGSRPLLDSVIAAVLGGRANISFAFGEEKLFVDRGRVFWLKIQPPQFPKIFPIDEGSIEADGWKWDISIGEKEAPAGWEALWQGKVSLGWPPRGLPKGKYQLGPAGGSFRKKWNQKKIPAPLRRTLPIILENGDPVAHFFDQKEAGHGEHLSIEIKRIVC